jgi:hypothetical protein
MDTSFLSGGVTPRGGALGALEREAAGGDRRGARVLGADTSRVGETLAVFHYIEAWYNPRRLHSSLGYQSPNDYEETHQERKPETVNITVATSTSILVTISADSGRSTKVLSRVR